MSEQNTQINWDDGTREKFKLLLGKIPGPLRGIAEQKVSTKAESLVLQDNRSLVMEKDLVDACFEETPFGFHGPVKCDMEEFQIDYVQYGYQK